jgi:hypothetical protein
LNEIFKLAKNIYSENLNDLEVLEVGEPGGQVVEGSFEDVVHHWCAANPEFLASGW